MDKFFGGILRLAAWICALLFIVGVGITLLLFNAERRLFNANLYLRALESQNFYERLPALAAETFAAVPPINDPNNPRIYLEVLATDDLEIVFRGLLPPDLSQSMTKQVLTSVFDYLNGRSESASLSLVEFRSNLTGPSGAKALTEVLRAQPDCTLEQLAKFTLENLFGESAGLTLCNPSEEMLLLMQPAFKAELQTVAATLPDNVELTPSADSAANPMQGLRVARAVMRFSPLLPLGFLFLITIIAVRDLKSWLNWWGIPLILGGLFGLIAAISISPILKWAFARFLQPTFPTFLPASVMETTRGLIGAVLSGVATPIVFQSITLLLIGTIMTLSTRIRRPAKPASLHRDKSNFELEGRIQK